MNNYWPLIIAMNYKDNNKQYAMMSYGVFTKDSKNEIIGAHIEKQVVLVSYFIFYYSDFIPTD